MSKTDFLYFCPFAIGFFHPIANKDAINDSMKKIDSGVASKYIGLNPEGFSLGADDNGLPTWVKIKLSKDELFNSEMNALNATYDKAMADLSFEYNVALARDRSTETEKVKAIIDKITALDGKYEADQTVISNKYFGE